MAIVKKKKAKPKKRVKPKAGAVSPSQVIEKGKPGGPIYWTAERIAEKQVALEKWIADPESYYFTKFLAQENLDSAQLVRMCTYSDSFRQAVDLAKRTQEIRLVELAVSRKGDGGFIKFILQNKAGWHDKTQISGDGANPLTIIMDRIASSSRNQLEDYDDD